MERIYHKLNIKQEMGKLLARFVIDEPEELVERPPIMAKITYYGGNITDEEQSGSLPPEASI